MLPIWPLYLALALHCVGIGYCVYGYRLIARDVALIDRVMGAGYAAAQCRKIKREVVVYVLQAVASVLWWLGLQWLMAL